MATLKVLKTAGGDWGVSVDGALYVRGFASEAVARAQARALRRAGWEIVEGAEVEVPPVAEKPPAEKPAPKPAKAKPAKGA